MPGKWDGSHLCLKKSDESNKANYRPVTVLLVLNNIYEKLLAARLVNSIALFCRTLLVHIGSSTIDWKGLEVHA